MIKIYDNLRQKLEEFKPVQSGEVRMYVCGPTVYNHIHIGNARPIIVFDTVRRYFEYSGYKVRYIQNFTDVDDKMIKKANEEGITVKELGERYIKEYFKDIDGLNINEESTIHPKATDNIKEMIEMIQILEKKGIAYEKNGDVYYSIEKFDGYGKLSHQNMEELESGSRVDINEEKNSPLDFALWKKAKPNEPEWDSPWGKGRPGWHIECSAMSMKYLGETIDIHAGGVDLAFPHHENEIAQSEGCTGKPFANYWMHNGFLNIKGEKMSKSAGNFFLLKDILAKYEGRVVRFYMLSSHYSKPIDFSDEELSMAKSGLERIDNSMRRINEVLKEKADDRDDSQEAADILDKIDAMKKKYEEGMNEDFNTAIAVGSIFEGIKEVNIYLDKGKVGNAGYKALEKIKNIFEQLITNVLGIKINSGKNVESSIAAELIDFLLDMRWQAKTEKNWATADKIRNKLLEIGIKIEDKKDKSSWSF